MNIIQSPAEYETRLNIKKKVIFSWWNNKLPRLAKRSFRSFLET